MLVREVMTREAVTVTPQTSVKDALTVLEQHRITAAPVVDAELRIQGVVSEVDLIRDLVPTDQRTHAWPNQQAPTDRPRSVVDVMTTLPVTVGPNTDVAAAIELMTTLNIKSVPVVGHDHRVLGMLSRSDIVRVLAQSDDELERQVDAVLAEVGLGDWEVTVTDGAVQLTGPEDSPYRMTARAVAESVPGVVDVQVRP
ncbi:CBS domain-containing protein [Nocardioides sp.]|uniref:CBS domain-containing protein n=1 Tax=Nocardioides sp. TaxID=35761 RepID=UPI001A23E871|nr:CBS domain-containing protein [Nocardioides sp.]MBJ7359318.1 CBS domain-containing protein [Nocardioides sp.]